MRNVLTFMRLCKSVPLIFFRYPFYGIQFHPEKNIYEWVRNRNISHSARAIKANSYFGDFLVGQARMSQHSFANVDEENSKVIYNYNLKYTGLKGSAYEQIYAFTGNEDLKKMKKTQTIELKESEPHAYLIHKKNY